MAGLTVKTVKIRQMGLLPAVVEEMVRTTHHHSLLFLYIYLAKVCVCVLCAVLHFARVWPCLSPLTIGHAMIK